MANDRNIAAGPPKGPRRVTYGAKGLKTGVPKDMQRRNLYGPGAGGGGRPTPTQPPRTDQFPNPNVPTTPPNHPGTPIVPGMPPNGWEPLPGMGGRTKPTAAFLAKLKAAGLTLGPNGKINGMGMGTDEQLALAQRGYNKFGLTNTFFDPTRAGARGGSLFDLGTGSGLRSPNGSGDVLKGGQLANMRERSGYDPAVALANSGYNANSGQAFQSPEMYQRYLDAARANYIQGAGGTPNARGQALLDAGTINQPSGDVPLLSGGGGGTPTGPGAVNTGGMPDGTGGPTYAGSTNLGSASNLGQVTNGTNQPLSMSSLVNNSGGGGNAGSGQGYLPPTANYEAGNRGLEDQLSSTLASLGVAREQIPAEVNRIVARLNTDQTYATHGLYDDLGQRGLTMDGVGGYLGTRDVAIPFGREYQDTALQAAQQYAQLAQQEGEAYLGYNQGDMENLLARAAEIIQQMPLSLQQSRNAQTQRRKPKKGKKGKGGRGRG